MMHGLTIRWSLADAPQGVEEALFAHIEAESYPRYSGRPGLRFKTWRIRPGEWFEGFYVFETPADLDRFQADFAAKAADAPSSRIIGSAPVLIEPCVIMAVAEGAAGFVSAASFG
jgi:hypothetical protein